MSKITQVYYKELPPYTQLIDTPIAKDTKKTVGKLIDRINKYNSRGEDEFIWFNCKTDPWHVWLW